MAKAAYVWDGTQFVSLNVPVGAVPDSVVVYNSASPVNAQIGTLWFDVSASNLKVYTGSTWSIVSSQGGESGFNPFFLLPI